jgi:hypothetical protein
MRDNPILNRKHCNCSATAAPAPVLDLRPPADLPSTSAAPVAAEHLKHVLYAVQAALHLPAAALPAAAIRLCVQPVVQ